MSERPLSLLFFPLVALFVLPLLGAGPVAAQDTGTVTGRAVDDAGAPLTGVNVVVENTSLGAATESDGRFRLTDVPTGPQTLVARFVGYHTVHRDVTVSPDETVSVRLSLTARPLEMSEVTVEASRSERATNEIAQAVSVIDEATIRRQSNGVQLDNSLNLVPGFKSLNRMGTDDSRFVMRGMGARNPWGINGVEVLIDGVPLSGLTGNTRV